MLKDEIRQIYENAKHDEMQFYEKIKRHPLRCLIPVLIFILFFTFVLWALIELPQRQVSHFDINNATQEATLENLYRATIAQILGGSAVAIGIYFAWGNLITAREGQITERFTRAVDQLGNENLEIRLGGIYALERIANESDKDYWPIMEILTAYVRKNSRFEVVGNKKATHISMDIQANESTKNGVSEIKEIPIDIQAILTVIGRRKHYLNEGKFNHLNLERTELRNAQFNETYLENATLVQLKLAAAQLKGTDFFND